MDIYPVSEIGSVTTGPGAAAAGAAGQTGAPFVGGPPEEEAEAAYEAIVQKAGSGQALSAPELDRLRASDPARYAHALQLAEARSALRREMEKTPNLAGQVAHEAIAEAQAEDDDTSGRNAALVRALNDEYQSFARHYDQVEFDTPAGGAEE